MARDVRLGGTRAGVQQEMGPPEQPRCLHAMVSDGPGQICTATGRRGEQPKDQGAQNPWNLQAGAGSLGANLSPHRLWAQGCVPLEAVTHSLGVENSSDLTATVQGKRGECYAPQRCSTS
eukprot:jgi/Bigna1/132848/aug1.19_g7556